MPRIVVALQNDFADWEPALLTAAARYYLGCEVVTASPDGKPVLSMGGMKVMPDIGFDAISPDLFDALVIPGGYAWEKGIAFDFSPLLREFEQAGKVVGGICAAASAVAASGILDDVAHTGNSLASHQRYPGYHGAASYEDRPAAVRGGKIVTAAGSAPVSFAVEVLKALDLWTQEAEDELAAFSAEHPPRVTAA